MSRGLALLLVWLFLGETGLAQPTSWNRLLDRLSDRLQAATSLGAPPASPSAVQAAEARLGSALPASYRDFLLSSNGLRWPQHPLGPVEKIEWLRTADPKLVQGSQRFADSTLPDAVYLTYWPTQDPGQLRIRQLPSMLKVGDWGDRGELVLLNPSLRKSDGEWEVWLLSTRFQAVRYPSFGEWLEAVAAGTEPGVEGRQTSPGARRWPLWTAPLLLGSAFLAGRAWRSKHDGSARSV